MSNNRERRGGPQSDATYLGARLSNQSLRRLVEGRGIYVDDIALPRLLHAAFLRSPFAHARILGIDTSQARQSPGVALVFTGAEMKRHVSSWKGVLSHIPSTSAVQSVFAVERACWQGEPVAMAVAETRAEAEDALEAVKVEWQELPAVAVAETALDARSPLVHSELASNVAFERNFDAGGAVRPRDPPAAEVAWTLRFDRQTGVTPEPRAILADFSADRNLTVYHSGQTPHVLRAVLALHLGLDEEAVRVICRDVGGSYGVKLNLYGDEIATAAAAMLLKRPVKFVADRLESFVTDIHARAHVVQVRMGVDRQGRITGFEIDDLMEIGAYAAYPRGSVHEVNQLINMAGAPYEIGNYRARGKAVFQNKNITSQLRGVAHPMTTVVCEATIDRAARAAGLDPAAFRLLNLVPDDAYPRTSATQRHYDGNTHEACLKTLLEFMDYQNLREEQAQARAGSIHRGIGISVFVESTAPGPTIYGSGGAPISAQDSTTISLEPSGAVLCASGVTEQGQGTQTMLAQIAADAVGVPIDQVRVVTGDTARTPCGGGTWGSRGAAIGGEATWNAGRALRANLLAVAGRLLQAVPDDLDIRSGAVIDRGGAARITLAELARIAYYRGAELPDDVHPEFRVTRSFRARGDALAYTNGAHGVHLELDIETGFVLLLDYWVVEDCGRMVNPLLVEEQIRGGVGMGIGWALLEQCVYDASGQLLNGTMADYLVPMTADLPDIHIRHLQTPTKTSELGIKGAGESGVIGAPAAILNAVNDALQPFGACVSHIPATPRHILEALRLAEGSRHG